MSKEVDLEKQIMEKIKSDKITMKPKWYFTLGSILSLLGLIGLGMTAIYLINIVFFVLRRHGPMGVWRLEAILTSLPLWIPLMAVIAVFLGIRLLKRYDFSYKKNFYSIIIIFILSVIVSAWLIDTLGINESWSKRGPMRRFYQQNFRNRQF